MDSFGDKKIWKKPKFFIGVGFFVVMGLVFVFGTNLFGDNRFFSAFSASLNQTFGDVFGFKGKNLLYEVDLGEESLSESSLESPKDSDLKLVPAEKVELKEKGATLSIEKVAAMQKPAPSEVLAPKVVKKEIRDCSFSSAAKAGRKIYFNEIAWMGGKVSSNDEWMELKNNFGAEVDLEGWQIKNQSEKIKIVFKAGEKIASNGFYLLERTDDNSVLDLTADKIYVGALSNSGEWLKLFDVDCNLIDEVNASLGWVKLGGDNTTKKTLERNLNDVDWHTSNVIGGTPRTQNSQ